MEIPNKRNSKFQIPKNLRTFPILSPSPFGAWCLKIGIFKLWGEQSRSIGRTREDSLSALRSNCGESSPEASGEPAKILFQLYAQIVGRAVPKHRENPRRFSFR